MYINLHIQYNFITFANCTCVRESARDENKDNIMLQIMKKTNVFGAVQNSASSSSRITNFTKRFAVLTLLLLTFVLGTRAQNYYVFLNDSGYYLENNNGSPRATTTFSPSCVWIASRTLSSYTSSSLQSYIDDSDYLRGSTSSLSIGNSQSNWRTNDDYLRYRQSTNNQRYIGYQNTNFTFNSNSSSSRDFRAYSVDITTNNGSEEISFSVPSVTINPTSADIMVPEDVTFTATATESVTQTTLTQKAYTKFSFGGNEYFYEGTSVNDFGQSLREAPAKQTSTKQFALQGYTYTLSDNLTTCLEGYSTMSSITFTSKNPDEEVVTGSITVTPNYGNNEFNVPSATATITVRKKLDNPTGISAQPLTLAVDEQKSISYTLTPSNAYDNIVYSGNYNGIISIDANGVVKGLKAGITEVTLTAKNLNGTNSEHSATSTVTVTPKAPTIEFSLGANITATISTTEIGATIYYTTDGTTPTTSSPVYTAPILVTAGATVKAIVVVTVNGTQLTSPVAEALANAESGIVGNTVFLYDLEDHNWSYYQASEDLPDGYPDELHSPYPRNIKITYYGYGEKTLSTSEVATPAANTFDTNTSSSDVKVGIGENENTFVYFKTLERDANGLYPYRMIFNPFYVRPKSGTIYTGFYKWRVKSITGGSISNANGTTIATTNTTSTDNVWLDADETYYFNPSDNGETNVNNATSMNVEFEALWAPAEVSTSGTFAKGYNSVERNFYVRRNNAASNVFSSTTPCTYSSFYPNGTTNGTDAATMNNRVSVQSGTAKADSKVEYHIWSSTTTLNTGGFKVDIGRGMTASGNGPSLTPLSGNHNSDKNARLRIETGTYNGGTSNLYGTPSVGDYLVHLDLILGSDYDRAQNNNNLLSFASNNTIQHGAHTTSGTSDRWLSFQHLDIWVKSGKIQSGYWEDGSASYNRTFYCRSTLDNSTRPGITYLTVEGGEFASINGGRGNKQEGTSLENDIVFSARIKGGTIHGSIYGAASANPSFGGRRVVMTGGMVEGWIAGGCDGTSSGGGATLGNSYFYIGGNAKVGNTENPNRELDETLGGNIFGAGRGTENQGNSANPASMKNAFIAVADKGFVLRNVCGGGDHGYTGVVTHDGDISEETAVNIFVLGGTVQGGVFGGGNNNNSACSNANIIMTGGLVQGGLYGGSNNSGTIAYNVTMQINGGQVGTSSAPANIHGGGYGNQTKVNGNVEVTLGTVGQTSSGVTVYGDVYGGSALGTVNSDASDHTYVTMYKGTINGSLYGGGLGRASVAANVNGPVKVEVHGGNVKKTSVEGSGGVYGANNIYGAPQSSVTVDIYGTDPAPAEGQYALHAVYGGGNKANYNGTPVVTVHECDNSIEYVYGGGNAAAVAATDVTIWGGNVIGNVFGGGNGAVSAADVNGNATTKIYGGTILNVYGGSNSQGTISGAINVTVNSQAENSGDSPCTMNIGDVYGGGNRAASDVGNLNIVCTGTDGYINRVFGGANAAEITGNVELEINGGNIGSVFGGNNSEQSISGDVTVNIGKAPNSCGVFEIGNVHGGGYGEATGVKGNVEVNIAGGTINGDVYGGSALGKVNTNTSNTTVVNLTGGIIHGDAYGGGLGDSETAADVNGNVTVTLDGTAFTLATTKDDDDNTIPTSGRVFGCNNINGSPKGTVLVKVLSTVAKNGDGTIKDKPTKNSGIYELQAVYGGGNLAAYNPTNPKATGQYKYSFNSETYGEVNFTAEEKPVQVVIDIDACDEASIEYVYGGGNAAPTPATDVIVLGSYEIGNVFGGGNGKDRCTLDGGNTWNENPGADVGIIDAAAYAADHTKGLYGTGKSKASVLGGTVHNLFGASNTKGNVVAESLAYVDNAGICTLDVGGIYGGGNEAYMDGDSKIELGCIEAMEEIYGGARDADVKGDINLTISSGHFDRVFGGNNIGGTINGSITVTIKETGCNPITIGELYGCGNQAAYTTPEGEDHPTINLISFTSIGNVFGGGFGEKAVVKGNPTVNINVTSIGANANRENWSYNGSTIDFGNDYKVTLPLHKAGEIGAIGTVYGGGNAAKVIGNTTVKMTNGIVENTLFGGGNAADVEGNTSVTILDGTIGGNVYGGGNQGNVAGATKVQIGLQPAP